MIKIVYSSWLSTRLNKSSEEITQSSAITDVKSLISFLRERKGEFESVFKNDTIIHASLNGKIITPETAIHSGDEIIFFAPIAGG